jgi:asparagine synthase (glutamine-hydrolysing)
MSGIAGIIRFDGGPVAPGLVEAMTGAMTHRGPDGIRHWVRGPVAVGQCMLCTTPESLAERQPLADEDESLVLVMDGRVDNWKELRHELQGRGSVLRDRTDAELVLRAYEAWGRDCVAHIDGDFALVIWDARHRRAFCARDRMGNKPLHYHWDGATLAFASEVHAIVALPWVGETLNEGMVAEFLAYDWRSRDETFWVGVKRLVAAHRMDVDVRGTRGDRYWEPDSTASPACASDAAYAVHHRMLLSDTVRRMSRAPGPLACEVSGGLDSSAIFAVAEHLRRQNRLLAPRIDAYTLAFGDVPGVNDLPFARAVVAHLGTALHEIAPTRMPLAWYSDWARRYRDFPSYPNGVMGLGIREAAQGRGSRALLVGAGGDEWLSGSRSHYADALRARDWSTLLACVDGDRRAAGLPRALGWAFRYGAYRLLPEPIRRLVRNAFRRRSDKVDGMEWLAPAMRTLAKQRKDGAPEPAMDPTDSFARHEQHLTLTSAYSTWARELEERMAASVGIEVRRPFDDARMVEFAFATSHRLRLRGSVDKHLHRQAMKGLLPDQVLTRERRAEFSITFRWYASELQAMLARTTCDRGDDWVDRDKATQLHRRSGTHAASSVPDWMVWSLFGCMAMASARDDVPARVREKVGDEA